MNAPLMLQETYRRNLLILYITITFQLYFIESDLNFFSSVPPSKKEIYHVILLSLLLPLFNGIERNSTTCEEISFCATVYPYVQLSWHEYVYTRVTLEHESGPE